MTDDIPKFGGNEVERIDIEGPGRLSEWARALNTSPERLLAAVQAVGDQADKVRTYLADNG
jgi:hypothetical protein